MSVEQRLLLSSFAGSAWLALLLTGHILGGGAHLLLLAALVAFPRSSEPDAEEAAEPEQEE